VPDGVSLGDKLTVTGAAVIEALSFWTRHALALDDRAVQKFTLPTAAASPPPASVARALTESQWPDAAELVDPEEPLDPPS
jgi:hypothetical protein